MTICDCSLSRKWNFEWRQSFVCMCALHWIQAVLLLTATLLCLTNCFDWLMNSKLVNCLHVLGNALDEDLGRLNLASLDTEQDADVDLNSLCSLSSSFSGSTSTSMWQFYCLCDKFCYVIVRKFIVATYWQWKISVKLFYNYNNSNNNNIKTWQFTTCAEC